jgi:hypothetical protein
MTAASSPSQPAPPRSRWRTAAQVALMLVAAAYLAYALRGQWPGTRQALQSFAAWQVGAAIALAALMCTLKGVYHEILLVRISGQTARRAEFFHAYALAQIVRYLPGKIWNLVYQSARLAHALPARHVVTANLVQVLLTNWCSAWVLLACVGAIWLQQSWLLLGLIIAVVVTEWVHRNPIVERTMIAVLRRVLGKSTRMELADIPPLRVAGSAILFAEWIAYYAMWLALLAPSLGALGALTQGTWYAAASLLALFALIVPGGLAVREALFVALGAISGIDGATLLAIGIVARVVLTLGELVCVGVAAIRVRHARG